MPTYLGYKYFGPNTAAPPVPPQPGADIDDFLIGLVAMLKADPAITAVVAGRVFPEHPPASAGSDASLCYQVWSERRTDYLNGPTGWPVARIRFTARSLYVADCNAIRNRLRNWFDGYSGNIGDVYVNRSRFFNVHDIYHDPLPGADKGTVIRYIDIKFQFREARPTNV